SCRWIAHAPPARSPGETGSPRHRAGNAAELGVGRALMRFISPLLKRALYPGMSNLGMFRRSSLSGNCCVVTYHGVLPRAYESKDAALDGSLVSAANLCAQLSLLKSHYHLLHPDEFRAYLRNETELPPRSVLLTCDDGLQNVLSEMLPVLQEAGVSCMFFL